MTPRRTERGLDRLVNFSDATVAIAITLLILPLVEVASEYDGDLGRLVGDNVGTFLAFAITFLVIGRFWVLHHGLFEQVRGYTGRLLEANLVWLASIVFLPFAANVLSHADGGPAAHGPVYALYIGTMIVTSGSTLWMRALLSRDPALVADDGDVQVLPAAVAVITLAVALVLALLVPQVGMLWLLLLVLAGPATRILRRRSRHS
ncbi:putative membrane protein [Diaminobutyricimonas aerilata]|uniref:Putative membrane protein n=1 Tax=Diaminobutyricimonas aerilata TaxID=1162967 RepID=A0A2M9CML9_9MICO|nr:TMEM175 family protein [Diaminobutyricimonas aerilata]PJJ73137.1 putative membrane protein [Diaminobutyricimonas aerilata]